MDRDTKTLCDYETISRYYSIQQFFGDIYGDYPKEKDSTGRTTMMLAARKGKRIVVEMLIYSGADIHCCDNYGSTVLHHASAMGRVVIVQCLLSKGIAIDKKNSYGKTALMVAIQGSHIEVAKLLINSGADIHCCDEKGWTVLHHASRKGLGEIVHCLVDKGVALDKKLPDGETSLLMAARYLQRDVVELLIMAGADVHCCHDDGWTLLHHASYEGWLEIVCCLVSVKEVELDKKTADGATALHLAVRRNEIEILQILLYAGADCNIEDKKGHSALFYAIYFSLPSEAAIECIKWGGYLKPTDCIDLWHSSEFILQDYRLCTAVVINKFNNKDLPSLYNVSALKLPHIEKLRIIDGSRICYEVLHAVYREIQAKGFYNLFKVVPPVLGMLCVTSFVENEGLKRVKLLKPRNGVKRLGCYNKQEYPCKKLCNRS